MFAFGDAGQRHDERSADGQDVDDNRPCLDALDWLTEDDRREDLRGERPQGVSEAECRARTARGSVPVTLTPFARKA